MFSAAAGTAACSFARASNGSIPQSRKGPTQHADHCAAWPEYPNPALQNARRVAVKAQVYFEVMTTLGVGLVAVNCWRPGAGMDVDPRAIDTTSVKSYISRSQGQGVVSFLMNVIPSAVVGAFAEGNILQVPSYRGHFRLFPDLGLAASRWWISWTWFPVCSSRPSGS
jgi:hypothetical protein